MPTVQKSLRVPDKLVQAIADAADAAARDFTALANELLSESVAMRRCPGITFMDDAAGRRPQTPRAEWAHGGGRPEDSRTRHETDRQVLGFVELLGGLAGVPVCENSPGPNGRPAPGCPVGRR
jgi:hypothetical protein